MDARREDGFTMMEVMAAALILVVGILGTLAMLDGANSRVTSNRAREAATNLAREVIEASRAVPYPEIAPDTVESLLQEQPGLADARPAAGWNVERRGSVFTVSATSCIMDDDDPRDGTGDHTGLGTFCANSPGGGTVDRNPDDYKRVSIRVEWESRGRTVAVDQTAVINNPGSAFAPSVRALRPTTPALLAPYTVLNATTTAITFTANITPRAAQAEWFVDGIKMGAPARTVGDDWTFTWSIGPTVPDGIYLISVRGYNSAEQSGNAKAISVKLNRYKPALPAGLAAGRNGSVGLEFEWSAAPDRDITGYRVYRMVGTAAATSDTLICSTLVTDALPTSCTAPDSSSGDRRYYVVAVAPTCCGGSGSEESVRPTAAQTVLVSANVAPNPPQLLTGVSANGVVKLTWQPPQAPAAGETADTLRLYRVYRDGKDIGSRYGRVAADAVSFVDAEPGTGGHKYWVTAVDSHMAESAYAGEVQL
jgi:Tfp pilus assembly protein PilV